MYRKLYFSNQYKKCGCYGQYTKMFHLSHMFSPISKMIWTIYFQGPITFYTDFRKKKVCTNIAIITLKM